VKRNLFVRRTRVCVKPGNDGAVNFEVSVVPHRVRRWRHEQRGKLIDFPQVFVAEPLMLCVDQPGICLNVGYPPRPQSHRHIGDCRSQPLAKNQAIE